MSEKLQVNFVADEWTWDMLCALASALGCTKSTIAGWIVQQAIEDTVERLVGPQNYDLGGTE